MADLLSFAPVRVFDDNGDPGAGYKASFYRSGTTSAVTVYASDGVTVLEQPVEADAEGVFPSVLFNDAGAVKAVITDASDATVYTVDPVVKVPAGASGASEVTFSPTVDLPFDNVQEAIEGAAATAASGFTPYGLGVTGLNALIADIDATGTASGAYRYDNTTTGTFPSGVTAAGTGIVEIWRETSGDAVMMLYSGAANASYMRRLASSTWGSWTKILLQSDVLDEDDFATDSATLPPSQQSSKAYMDAIAATIAQIPQTATGAGQWRLLSTGQNAALNLPSGGTWAYFVLGVVITSGASGLVNVDTTIASVAAGGTTIRPATAGVVWLGIGWRVS